MTDAPTGDDARLPVAFLGDAFVDVHAGGVGALPQWGTDTHCEYVSMLIGGSCANTARHCASLGRGALDVSFFSVVGDDELGVHFVTTLAGEGLLRAPHDTLVPLRGVPQSSCVVLSGPSDRALVSCYTSVGKLALSHLARTGLCGDGSGGPTRWRLLHIGGYFNCPGLHTDALLALAAEAQPFIYVRACVRA